MLYDQFTTLLCNIPAMQYSKILFQYDVKVSTTFLNIRNFFAWNILIEPQNSFHILGIFH